jgi:signal peptidase II
MQATGGASLSDAQQSTADTHRRRRVGWLFVTAAVVLAADLASKIIAVSLLEGAAPVEVLPGLLTLRLVRNPGAAFGVAGGLTVIFSLVAAVVIVAILRTTRRLRSAPWAACLGLLLGGAVGNLVDRVFRSPGPLRGHVVDFLELPHWPVFNLADSAIVLGGVLAVALTATGRQLDGTRSGG